MKIIRKKLALTADKFGKSKLAGGIEKGVNVFSGMTRTVAYSEKRYSTVLGKGLTGYYKIIKRKSGPEALKLAAKKEKDIERGIAKGLYNAERAYYQPGLVVNKGVKETIKNPVTAIGTVAGKVTDVTNPETIVIPKATIAAAVGNRVIPKKGRERLLRLSDKYGKSSIAKTINKIPSVPEMAKTVQILGAGLGM